MSFTVVKVECRGSDSTGSGELTYPLDCDAAILKAVDSDGSHGI